MNTRYVKCVIDIMYMQKAQCPLVLIYFTLFINF